MTEEEINAMQGTEEYDDVVRILKKTGHSLHYVACAEIAKTIRQERDHFISRLKEKDDRLQEAEKQVASLLLLNGAKEAEQSQPLQATLEDTADVRMEVAIILLSGYERLALAVLGKI